MRKSVQENSEKIKRTFKNNGKYDKDFSNNKKSNANDKLDNNSDR
ncbi:hypothetical protein SH1V18_12440 [Vallitalea longa]|uniref:Uncharacterized protein n=1 Tax=Vallitalea longa TaxID=2936439 RepID=A0A9W5YB78_9FIRM|nr:hypothetical protein [Vallitalea longa]GKX28764.1 hypothetical protein SH1V18_12440 [Vallitalea longa]